MTLFVDTSVWSLAFRRDTPVETPQTSLLAKALDAGETVVTTGLVLQELLQGFEGARNRRALLERFADLPFLEPAREDYIKAADLKSRCRKGGVQIGTIDALLAQLCLRHEMSMLTADKDFIAIAKLSPLQLAIAKA
ncbi:MAG: PIN domain-containing protein [Parvularculaceae bacterium]|nr:PIN domain-containing protein [Parvularculaceae bacterium]